MRLSRRLIDLIWWHKHRCPVRSYAEGWVLSLFSRLATFLCLHFNDKHSNEDIYSLSFSSAGKLWGKLIENQVGWEEETDTAWTTEPWLSCLGCWLSHLSRPGPWYSRSALINTECHSRSSLESAFCSLKCHLSRLFSVLRTASNKRLSVLVRGTRYTCYFIKHLLHGEIKTIALFRLCHYFPTPTKQHIKYSYLAVVWRPSSLLLSYSPESLVSETNTQG